MSRLVPPHGGANLKPLSLEGANLSKEIKRAANLPQVHCSSREFGDVIMLGIGGFTPLNGFMGKGDWEGVCLHMMMTDEIFWPIPITLSTNDESIRIGDDIALTYGQDKAIIATMTVTEKYSIDKDLECISVYKTTDQEHPGVALVKAQGKYNLAGPIKVLSDGHFSATYGDLYMTPSETRAYFEEKGWSNIAAFQTRNPMHRSHEYLAKIAIEIWFFLFR